MTEDKISTEEFGAGHICAEDLTEMQKRGRGPFEGIERLVEEWERNLVKRALSLLNDMIGNACNWRRKITETGYEFRNAFEYACYTKNVDEYDNSYLTEVDIDFSVRDAARKAVQRFEDRSAIRVLVAWYSAEIGNLISNDSEEDQKQWGLDDSWRLTRYLIFRLEDQMWMTYRDYLCNAIEKAKELQEEKHKEEFEYEGDDFAMRQAIVRMIAVLEGKDREDDIAYLMRALVAVNAFYAKSEDVEHLSFYVNRDNGHGFDSVSFSISDSELTMDSGGYFISDAGGDSYGDVVWSCHSYSHADGGARGVILSAVSMLGDGCELGR